MKEGECDSYVCARRPVLTACVYFKQVSYCTNTANKFSTVQYRCIFVLLFGPVFAAVGYFIVRRIIFRWLSSSITDRMNSNSEPFALTPRGLFRSAAFKFSCKLSVELQKSSESSPFLYISRFCSTAPLMSCFWKHKFERPI